MSSPTKTWLVCERIQTRPSRALSPNGFPLISSLSAHHLCPVGPHNLPSPSPIHNLVLPPSSPSSLLHHLFLPSLPFHLLPPSLHLIFVSPPSARFSPLFGRHWSESSPGGTQGYLASNGPSRDSQCPQRRSPYARLACPGMGWFRETLRSSDGLSAPLLHAVPGVGTPGAWRRRL